MNSAVTIKYYYMQDIVVPAYMLIFVLCFVGVDYHGIAGCGRKISFEPHDQPLE